ncbi:MAG: hypothetical protein ACYC0V_10530 [Armatimonadota bacterium]
MKRLMLVSAALLILILIATWIMHRPSMKPIYWVTEIGSPDYMFSRAADINNRGIVIGYANPGGQGFIWINGRMRGIDPPKYGYCSPISINDKGQVIAMVFSEGGVRDAKSTVWQDGSISELKAPGGCSIYVRGINNNGQIVGQLVDGYGKGSGFIIEDNRIRVLDTVDGMQADPQDINDKGQILVHRYNARTPVRSFILHEGQQTELTADGFLYKIALAINDSCDAVGTVKGREYGEKGVLWRDGKLIFLGSLRRGVRICNPLDLNNKNQVIGFSETNDHMAYGTQTDMRTSDYVIHPFIWENGRMRDLNDLIPRNSGWTLNEPSAINDKGQIVGSGVHDGKDRAYLLTPIGKTR